MKSAVLAFGLIAAVTARSAELPGPTAKIDPKSSVQIDADALADYDGYPLRLSWQHGFLVAGSRASSPARHDQVTVFDSDGKLLRKLNFVLPETNSALFAGSAILDNKGKIALVVHVLPADSSSPAPIIAFFDEKGRLTGTARPERFNPQSFCADANGEVWAFSDWRKGDREPEWPTIRHFAQDGQQLGGIMRSGDYGLRKMTAPSQNQLFCGKDRLSVFLGLERTYIEIGYDGKLLDKFIVPPITGSGAKSPYVNFELQLTEGGIIVALWGGNPYYLKRTSKTWTPINWEHDLQYDPIAGKQSDGSIVLVAKGKHVIQFDWLMVPLDLPDAYSSATTLSPVKSTP
jgi:hypothetical protein